MMELFRQVADSGKTVACITHSLANVEATCHLVVILTEGGRLAFVGTPDEAKQYFEVDRLGEVYRKLGKQTPEEWQTAFKSSPFYTRYVRDRLPDANDDEEEDNQQLETESRRRVNPLRQAWILTRRYLGIWRGDPQAIGAMLGQSLLVALLLGAVFGQLSSISNPAQRVQRNINLLFLMNVCCFWFGCNNASKELVKERVIFTRERDFNLRLDSYFLSKFVVLVVIALIQVSMLFGIVRFWCGPPGSAFLQWLALATVAVAGTSLGLLISAFSRSEEVAVALVPIAVMPQIILAGVIAPLSGAAKALADGAITCYWCEQGIEALLPKADLTLIGLEREHYFWKLALVAGHIIAFTAGTMVMLVRQSRSK